MSDSPVYEIGGEPLEHFSFVPGTVLPYLIEFYTEDDICFRQDPTSIVIDETVNGEVVGSADVDLFDLFVTENPATGGPSYFTAIDTGQVSTSGEFDAFPCFASGTPLATATGTAAVETLTQRDELLLTTGGVGRVAWVGHRRQVKGEVVRVRTHALGTRVPVQDLIVSADHGLFVDSVLVQAGLLVNGSTIRREWRDAVTFWRVELERHAILLAAGAPAESYLDTGNRRQFSNCPIGYDAASSGTDEGPCAEMVFRGRRLDSIKARLPAFA